MAWIESHQSIERHPKTIELMNQMGWDIDVTIGKLHRFWWWCVDYSEDGDLRKWNDGVLASAVGLNTDQGIRFVEAMVVSGFLDREPYFRVHDWWDYIGLFMQRRYRKYPEKWEGIKRLYEGHTPGQRQGVVLAAQPTDQPTKPTKPTNQKKKDDTPNPGETVENSASRKKALADATLRVFCSHLTQALKSKTPKHWKPVYRKAYGICVPLICAAPKEQKGLSEEIDKLPRDMPAEYYASAIRGMINRRKGKYHKKLGEDISWLKKLAEKS